MTHATSSAPGLTTREVHLVSRPVGWPHHENFSIKDASVPELAEGQVLVRNEYLSVDPYMRGRMNDAASYVPPFELGRVMEGGAVGKVVDSRSEALQEGDTVLHMFGWREHAVAEASELQKVDADGLPASAFLGVLGMPGLTAYVGLFEIAQFKPGDTVFVSGAAGAVGTLVGQMARLKGAARVVGSAGSAEKVKYLVDELGFDAAFNYKDGPVADQLAQAAPTGIDVFFDNVGGEHLEAAIGAMRPYGRAALCGAIDVYNETEPPLGPNNMVHVVVKSLRLQGFIITDYQHMTGEFQKDIAGWLRSGEIRFRETVVDGIDAMPDAFLGLLRGTNIGKMIVRVN